jgi:hypothetical protein
MLYVQRQVRHFNSGSRVVDPDPDPYVFGPPGSGSVIICTALDPDSSINKQKKILISTIFFTSLKTDVNIPSKRNKPKNDEKSMIRNWSRIRKSVIKDPQHLLHLSRTMKRRYLKIISPCRLIRKLLMKTIHKLQ